MIGDSLQVLGNHQHIHRHIGFVSIFFQKFDDFPFDTLKKGINQVISLLKGFCGFGMGATPNAMANMRALVERYGAAPRAFFIVPLVGSLFVDFFNSMVLTTFMNFL